MRHLCYRWWRCGVLLLSLLLLLIIPAPSAQAEPDTQTTSRCDSNVLAYPGWYNGLPCKDGEVELKKIEDIWIIILNIVQWVIITIGYTTLIFIIWGGFLYIIAQGDPGKLESAKSTIRNAVIGLIIALSAVMIIRTVQGAITGSFI